MQTLRGISLRGVVRGDLPLILTLFGDVDRAHLWGQRRVGDDEQLLETWRFWSRERMGAKFIILKQNRPVGLVFDYERSVEDGHTKVATLVLDDIGARGAGVIGTALFVQHLFQTVPFRKIYFDVFSFNKGVIAMLRKLGIQEETRRVEHRFWNGQFWDQLGFAVRLDEVADMMRRLSRGCQKPFVRQSTPTHRARPRMERAPVNRLSAAANDDALLSLLR